MKKILFISLTSLSLLLSTGCKKKKSETPAVDPCANTICLNGGTCVDGSCSCPTGYSGADCGTQRTPAKVTITEVKVTKFPALDPSGQTWDLYVNKNPDLLAVIKQGSTLLSTTGNVDNVAAGSITLLPVTAFDVTNLTSQLNIELWDEDNPPVDANDSMGSIDFSIYDSNNHFPTKLTVSNTAGTITFELTLTYTY